jgi:asparagine synthase (glutamine-hydrolysing)
MCGIAGFTNRSSADLRGLSPALHEIQRHRGPDDFGWLALRDKQLSGGRELADPIPGEVVLLHWRLSILDLTTSGWQPMSTADHRYHLVFNGEIYNYLELRRELEKLGVIFRSNSDTEVLLEALAQWGESCLTRLVGMFAFALFDARERTIFLARDFFGIKPLYYGNWKSGLVFASEIKTLLHFPGVSRKANAARCHQYLYSGRTDDGSETMFADIRQLPPAHWMRISIESTEWPEPIRYWEPGGEELIDIPYDEAVKNVRELMMRNIDLHLRSDVPVGAALSGGLDSSIIVAAMRHLSGPKAEIHTFTYIEPDSAVDEEKWADLINAETRAHPHKISLHPENLRHDFESLIRMQDQPFGSTSIYAQYAIFRAAGQSGIKVMLDGQGADEIFGGYTQFLAAKLASMLRKRNWLKATRFIESLRKLPGVSVPFVLFTTGTYFLPEEFHALARRCAGRSFEMNSLKLSWFHERGIRPNGDLGAHLHGKRALVETLRQDLTVSTLPSLLRYEDQNSMAHSVESRVPFLTPALVKFVYSLPEEFIISDDGRRKRVLRDAMTGIVPEAILQRRDKIGFATAEQNWLKQLRPWILEILGSETAREIPFLLPEAMLKDYDKVCGGRRRFNFRIWRWINFIEWVRRKNLTFE